MSEEFISKVRQTEAELASMKEAVNSHKETIIAKHKQEILDYKAELSKSLKEYNKEQAQMIEEEIQVASQEVDKEVEVYRIRLDREYDKLKDSLMRQGLREVLGEYGYSNYEESRSNL